MNEVLEAEKTVKSAQAASKPLVLIMEASINAVVAAAPTARVALKTVVASIEWALRFLQAAYLEAEAALGDVDRRSVIVRSPLAPSLRLGHVLNPRSHVRNGQRGGKPRGALGYCSEGPPFGKKFVEPLDPMLEAYSVTRVGRK